MPQLSDTMTEGTLVKWNKKEGDAVKAGEEIAEVETDKATMPAESSEAGTLAYVAIAEGGKVPVGGLMAVIALKGENAADVKAKFAGGKSSAPKSEAKAESTSSSSTPAKVEAKVEAKSEGSSSVTTSKSATAVAEKPVNGHSSSNGGRIKASPLARNIAEDRGVDLKSITGSGPHGRIIQKDVEAAASGSKSSPEGKAKVAPTMPARVASGQTEKIELNKMRQVIALRLQQSKQQIPHFYETIDIDMTAAVALRAKLLAAYEKSEGVRVSIGDIIAKAVASTLKVVPQLNSTFDEKSNTITRHGDVNLGMAVALPDGLIVPVLRNIDQMGVKEIRVRSADIVDRARAQRLKKEEMTGATFTVSNLGTMGIREFIAIVNPPEVGILAIGTSEERAVVRNGQIVARTMMTVTLSADHRVVDGAVAATFLSTLKSMLEEPAMMLA
ncbi:MAG TPA: dihydrolipoamide acetyltransferase family protein [Tepidisphaeraceae bacterium]|nr:dihydrolipoamide acetyltransferase family protein [Tepidisphaeraceae bacterium]